MNIHSEGRLDNCLGKVYACRHEIADRFYELMFEQMPEVRELFTGDFRKQKEMFSMMVAMLGRCIANGRDPSELGEQIRAQHAGIAITPKLFFEGGVCLRQAYLDVLGDQIGPFEKEMLTGAIGRLIETAAGGPPEWQFKTS